MFAWIAENALTVAVIAVIIVIAGLAVVALVREKKKKKGGCTGNCATCGMGCSCGELKKDK